MQGKAKEHNKIIRLITSYQYVESDSMRCQQTEEEMSTDSNWLCMSPDRNRCPQAAVFVHRKNVDPQAAAFVHR